jgi:CheY-like chemotaxis protein
MKKKILLIDDDRMVVKTLERLLIMEGYDVVIAMNGHEALKVISIETVDLVISDIRMPDINGIQLMRSIQEYYKQCQTTPPPVIFITGFSGEEKNDIVADLKPVDLLYKPFDKDAFLLSIRGALGSA